MCRVVYFALDILWRTIFVTLDMVPCEAGVRSLGMVLFGAVLCTIGVSKASAGTCLLNIDEIKK